MIREHIFSAKPKADERFRWRSREPSRLEGFSDAVFAFAMTLLVVSLEAPKTFDQLVVIMQGFVAFGVTFLLLVIIWHAQYIWFRRYALDDMPTTILTMVLLFVIMFFIYPLKFFSAFTLEFLRNGGQPKVMLDDGTVVQMLNGGSQFLGMMAIYSAGYAAIFALFACLYAHALRQRDAIGLTPSELVETRFSFYQQVLHAGVGSIAVLLAVGIRTKFAMFSYFLIPPLQYMLAARLRRERALLDGATAVPALAP